MRIGVFVFVGFAPTGGHMAALSFIKDKPLWGVGIGGGSAAAGLIFGSKVGAKLYDPAAPDGVASKVGAWLMRNPWAGGLVLGGAAFATLWFTKKKTAAFNAAASSALVLAPSVVQTMMQPALPAAPSAPADGATNGFGVAVAESRGFGAPPSIDVFSEAPSNITLLGNANNPDSALLPAAGNPSVFGGASF